MGEGSGVVGVGRTGKAFGFAEGDDVAFAGRNGDDGFSGGEDAVHFAGDDDAFETAFDGDEVGVGGGEDGGDFIAGEKREEADVGNICGSGFEALTLRAIADEDQADAVGG